TRTRPPPPRVDRRPSRSRPGKEAEHIQPDETDGDERKALARDVVPEQDHQRVGCSTTMLGRFRYRSAARAPSSAVTSWSARAYRGEWSQPRPTVSKKAMYQARRALVRRSIPR